MKCITVVVAICFTVFACQISEASNVQKMNAKYIVKSAQLVSSLATLAQICAIKACNAEVLVPSLGMQLDGILKLCPENQFSGCVSSQDDRPSFFLEPWTYDGPFENARAKLLSYVSMMKGSTLKTSSLLESNRYIRFEFLNDDGSIDDTEFYFTPNDSTVQFRSNRRGQYTFADFGVNRNRLNKIRIALDFEIVPVLRNRKEKFFFFESPLDDFGPPTIYFEQTTTGSPIRRSIKGFMAVNDLSAPLWEV